VSGTAFALSRTATTILVIGASTSIHFEQITSMASIYRTFTGQVTDGTTQYRKGGVYSADPRPTEEKSEAQLLIAATRNEAQKGKRGKAAPSNVALPRTLAWAAKLPPNVQPHELIRSFGRVANLLAANWDNAEATIACLNELLVDTRGCRTGFPPKVANELLALRSYYAVSVVGGIATSDDTK
jgi:hypothetical protein